MPAKRPQIAILASGSGSTAEALIKDIDTGVLNADVTVLITNNPDAGVLGRVARLNATRPKAKPITTYIVNRATQGGRGPKGTQSRKEAKAAIEILKRHKIDLVLCLGWMKKVVEIHNVFDTLNTHPGLLPFSAGLIGSAVQRYAIDKNQTHSGQTLHFVTDNYDEGEVIAEHKVPILPGDDEHSLFERVQVEAEKRYLASDIQAFLNSRR